MIARQLEAWLAKSSGNPKIIQIFGLRQTGKTTLMDKFRKGYIGALYYPLFDLVTLRRYESAPERFVLEIEEKLKRVGSGSPLHIFIDEVQKIPALFQAIQGLYEQNKGRVKFWIWGSSARPLKKHRAETLAGRSFSKVLWPLSQGEVQKKDSVLPLLFEPSKLVKTVDTEEPRDYDAFLKKCIQQTMLPEPHLINDVPEAQEILQSYQATYLENEIRRENLVDDIGTFEQFLALAAGEDTGVINYSSKARVLGVSPHTVKTYYGILKDTYVCREINAYSKSLRVQISKSPKIYFTDTGLARYVSGERGLPVADGTQFGKLVEGFVINEILKQVEYLNLQWKLSYLRVKSGMEVDLIISDGHTKIAAEIKAARKIIPQDRRSIADLMSMDKEIKYGIIFSRQSAPIRLAENIYNFPIWNL